MTPLILTVVLLACDGRRVGVNGPQDAAQSRPDGSRDKTEPDDQQRLFFGGQDAGHLYVLSLDPATEKLSRFGPAIPGADAASHRLKTIWSSWSRSRVIVEVQTLDDEPRTTILASDGKTFWPLLEDIDAVWAIRVSPRRGLVWVERLTLDAASEPSIQATLVTFAGDVVFTRDATAWQRTRFAAFALDDSWVLWLADSVDLNIVRPDGTQQVLRHYDWVKPDDTTVNGQGLIYAPFETSVILHDEGYKETWLDLTGKPIDVVGFDPTLLWRGGYQLDGNRLSRLSDREVTEVAELPQRWLDSEIRLMVLGQFAVLGTLTPPLEIVDAQGASIGTYEPLPPEDNPAAFQTIPASTMLAVHSGRTKAVLLQVHHSILAAPDRSTDLGLSYDVCRFEAGKTEVKRLRTQADDANVLRFQTAEGHPLVYWVEDGRLLSFDVATFDERPIETRFKLLSAMPGERRVSPPGS